MSLLHATWLRNPRGLSEIKPAIFLWADTWRIANPEQPRDEPALHPFSLSSKELKDWLTEQQLLPNNTTDSSASLTLPSKHIDNKTNKSEAIFSVLPLQAEETIPTKYEWWPWKINGLTLSPLEASRWLSKLPLSIKNTNLSEEILWWTHLQRWALKLIANGLWLPQVELNKEETSHHRARWVPLLNQENERKRLETFVETMPLVVLSSLPWKNKEEENISNKASSTFKTHRYLNPLASWRPHNQHFEVISLLEEIIDAQLRENFQPSTNNLDPLLNAWQKALGSDNGYIDLSNEAVKRLANATKNWKSGLSPNLSSAKTCLELKAPSNDTQPWRLKFFLQAESNPQVKIPAAQVWDAGSETIEIDGIKIEKPSELLLEGLGRTLTIFPAIERGLESPMPNETELSSAEAFLLIRTEAKKLRDLGISVLLPTSLSKGLANRLGITIKAELKESSKGAMLDESLSWNWKLMIGGTNLTMHELEELAQKKSPLLNHKGTWIELRPNDLKNAEKFFSNPPLLNLNEALNLTATDGNTLNKLPVHHFEAGPRLQAVLAKYHHKKEPEAIKAPNGFLGQLRPYQERGLGWLSFLYQFNQGACLADDMGLGKTIQLLAFIQHLKNQHKLSKPILLIAPTSVLTNWKREALTFTPKLSLLEHYGPKRCSNKENLRKSLNGIDIFITSYGLLFRDRELLKIIDWQGVVIDEAQAIKNPKAKQSIAIREVTKNLQNNPIRIALTGTPVENRISELWALMDFLNPKVLGEEEFFNQRYKLPIEHYGDISSLKDLKARVSPFILRRLKTDQSIISDLPSKIELNEWIHLSQEQEHLYNNTVEQSINEIASTPLGQRHGKTLGLLTRLKQICNHPALALKERNIDKNFLNRSTKLQRLEEILDEIIESNDRAILFTQFAEWGHLLQQYLEKRWESEVPFLHGGTSKINRQAMVDRFQEDPRGPNTFILSLKAGGLGINLTRANHVFHIDRWWNPAVENQATDRAYRIGQTKSVVVHKFITTGSIEEKIDQMILQKSQLAEDIVGSGENWLKKLSIEELNDLVALDKQNPEF